MIISNGYLLHLVLLDGLAQQSKHATAKDGDYDEDDSFVIVNCEQMVGFFLLYLSNICPFSLPRRPIEIFLLHNFFQTEHIVIIICEIVTY